MMDFEQQLSQEGSFISGEVILESFQVLLEYYPILLGASIIKLSQLLGQSAQEVLALLEEEQGMTEVLKPTMNKLNAGREVLGSLLGLNTKDKN
jgi:hypothetical protein